MDAQKGTMEGELRLRPYVCLGRTLGTRDAARIAAATKWHESPTRTRLANGNGGAFTHNPSNCRPRQLGLASGRNAVP
jgi:hypothetical protein